MVYVASYCCAVLFDAKPGNKGKSFRTTSLFTFLLAFNVLFTWA